MRSKQVLIDYMSYLEHLDHTIMSQFPKEGPVKPELKAKSKGFSIQSLDLNKIKTALWRARKGSDSFSYC